MLLGRSTSDARDGQCRGLTYVWEGRALLELTNALEILKMTSSQFAFSLFASADSFILLGYITN